MCILIKYLLMNAKHRVIKMKPVDLKSGRYIDCGRENNNKDVKFKACDQERISKYKTIFAKG